MVVWISFLYIISESLFVFGCCGLVGISILIIFPQKQPPSHQNLKKDEFYTLLSIADLAVITPLHDGMNTTSMEFVIA